MLRIFTILVCFIFSYLNSNIVFASDHNDTFNINITFEDKQERGFVLSYQSGDYAAMSYVENNGGNILEYFTESNYGTIQDITPKVFIDENGQRFLIFPSKSGKFPSRIHLNVVHLRDRAPYAGYNISELEEIHLAISSGEGIDNDSIDFTNLFALLCTWSCFGV
jgi:hypothetical protein